MIEELGRIADYLAQWQQNIRIFHGFPENYALTPIREQQAFVTLKSRDEEKLCVKVSVYSPSKMGGDSCLEAACDIYDLIEVYPIVNPDDGDVEEEQLTGLKYDDKTRCLVAEILFSLVKHEPEPEPEPEPEEVGYYFTAENFSENPGTQVSCKIPEYGIVRNFSVQPVMTVFEDIPIGVYDGANVYDITLEQVPQEFVEILANNGHFKLTLNGEVFDFCYCVKCAEKDAENRTVTIKGYKYTVITDIDEIIVH